MSKLEYLYVIEFQNGTVKVGRTTNPDKRLSDHRSTGKALGVPVTRAWVSDAHEGSEATEQMLLNVLGQATEGREWFREVMFLHAVERATDIVQADTEPAVFAKRLREAQDLLEAYTGRKFSVTPPKRGQDVLSFFELNEDARIMSSQAFEYYQSKGGVLSQKQFVAALEQEGIRRRRTTYGTQWTGIAIPGHV